MSVLLADSELDVSDSQSASSDLLSESSDVPEPYYWKYSTERSCWETFPLSRQSPEEIEEYKQVCAAAYQRALGFRPMMPSSSIHHPESEDSSSVEDPIASYSPPEWVLNDADEANLQTSWRRYNARCRRTDHLRLYAALSSGTFALHNLSARMHRAEALYFRDDSAKRVYDSPRVGFFEAYTRPYGVRLRRSIELHWVLSCAATYIGFVHDCLGRNSVLLSLPTIPTATASLADCSYYDNSLSLQGTSIAHCSLCGIFARCGTI